MENLDFVKDGYLNGQLFDNNKAKKTGPNIRETWTSANQFQELLNTMQTILANQRLYDSNYKVFNHLIICNLNFYTHKWQNYF